MGPDSNIGHQKLILNKYRKRIFWALYVERGLPTMDALNKYKTERYLNLIFENSYQAKRFEIFLF